MRRARQTIAILADDYIEYQKVLIDRIAAEIEHHGYGVLCITGSEANPEIIAGNPNALGARMYPVFQRNAISGLISLSGTIGNSVSAAELSAFVHRFDVPTVSIGLELAGMPNVLVDDQTGMVNLVEHLIADTEARKFAFVQGFSKDPYSDQREQIFRTILNRAGYQIDETCFVRGNYDPVETFQVVSGLLEKQRNIDAIVAANDAMALGAARAATSLGLDIPGDIMITGFDDTGQASRHSPALTTVRQPLTEMAKQSVELLLEQIHTTAAINIQHFSTVSVCTELVVRGSTIASHHNFDNAQRIDVSAGDVYREIDNAMSGLRTPDNVQLRTLTDQLWETISDNSDHLAQVLDKTLLDDIGVEQQHWWSNLCHQMETCCSRLSAVISNDAFVPLVVAALSEVKEKLWALSMEREFAARRYNEWHALMHLQMSSCTRHEDVLTTTASWLENIQPERWYLVWNENPQSVPSKNSYVVQSLCAGKFNRDRDFFATEDLLPEHSLYELHTGLMILNPIFIEGTHFGHVLIDPASIKSIDVASVSRSIGNAMRSRHLMLRLEQQTRDLEWANGELEQLANCDALTGLPNRFHFHRRLSQELVQLADHKKLAILFIDLDGFKSINDTMGHECGDQLLKIIAIRLKQVMDGFDANIFASRLGGDEFTMIFSADNSVVDQKVAELSSAILYQICLPCVIESKSAVVSASIGYSLSGSVANDAGELLSQADSAMYLAKTNGKNNIVAYTQALAETEQHRRLLEKKLRAAVENGDLKVNYQPRIDLRTGLICGAEALLRWVKETPDGLVTVARPDEFIEIAEQFGMIGELDSVALNQSLCQIKLWNSCGIRIPVSVNVSVMRLQQESFVSEVLECVARHDVESSLLELEITESAAMADVEENIARLQALKHAGIRLAIDDFGTGYSSLSYLKKFPVDNLKIDRSFIMELNEHNITSASETAVVRSIIALGKSMELGLVAEGVETDLQKKFVRSLGCDEGQGYFFYKPMAATELTEILLAQQGRLAA